LRRADLGASAPCVLGWAGGVVKLSGPGEPQPGLTHMRESFMVALPPDDLDEQPTLELERGRPAPERRVVRLERSTSGRRRTVGRLVGFVAAGALAVALLRRSVGESGPHPRVKAGGHVVSTGRCVVECGVRASRSRRVAPRLHGASTHCRSASVSLRSPACAGRHRRYATRVRLGPRAAPTVVVVARPLGEVERPAVTVPLPSVRRTEESSPVPVRGASGVGERAASEFGFEGHGR
jgi:hypothetical protein